MEDWELDIESDKPVINIPSKEYVKLMEERKLVEEADNMLTKELFVEKKRKEEKYVSLKDIPMPVKEFSSKQRDNELKQKEMSNRIKEIKMQNQRHAELFGKAKGYYYEDIEDKHCK